MLTALCLLVAPSALHLERESATRDKELFSLAIKLLAEGETNKCLPQDFENSSRRIMRQRIAKSVHIFVCRSLVLLFLILYCSLPATSETLVSVPAGTYNLTDVVTAPGSANDWIRYKAVTAGTVIIRGAGTLDVTRQYVVLDGFVFDGMLDPNYPARSAGFIILGSNVHVENSEVRGPADIHTGYNILGQVDCAEATGFPTGTGAFSISGKNVVLKKVLVHGFASAGTFAPGSSVTVQDSMFRNSFNGLTYAGDFASIRDSVLWVHPNHLNSLVQPNGGIVVLENNLIVDGQEMIQAGGPGWPGADELHLIHNTFYIPTNKPCYDFHGAQTVNVRQRLVVRDNLFINKAKMWLSVGQEVKTLQSDYNLFFHYDGSSRDEFRTSSVSSPLVFTGYYFGAWQALRGQDPHSLHQQRPLFANAPEYEDFAVNQWGFRVPSSVAEARSWFSLASGSPGKNAASDGTDMGINPVTTPPTPLSGTPAAPIDFRAAP